MLPKMEAALTEPWTLPEPPSRTFRLRLDGGAVSGIADGPEAVKQAVALILSTERYRYAIYGWDYGVELRDLIGQPVDYVQSELKRRITEALTWDSRITSVEDFVFTVNGKRVACTFTARTVYGDVAAEKAVEV